MKDNRKHYVSKWTLIVLPLMSLLCGAQENSYREERAKEWLETLKGEETEVLFYGRVVDQFSQPVVGAEVGVNVPESVGLMGQRDRLFALRTDSDGRFEVSKKACGVGSLRSWILLVRSFTKEGYEHAEGTYVSGFTFRRNYTEFHVADKSAPIIFRMRKKNLTASFIICDDGSFLQAHASRSGKPFIYDLIQRTKIEDREHLDEGTVGQSGDLCVTATFDTNKTAWTVVLTALGRNGGILVTNEMFYEAPETGYHKKYEFMPKDRANMTNNYIYIKSRNPVIYTRLAICGVNANAEFFRLYLKTATNPYGDRNLEAAKDVPYMVRKRLKKEANDALRQNRYPAKPDLQKLLIEAKTSREP